MLVIFASCFKETLPLKDAEKLLANLSEKARSGQVINVAELDPVFGKASPYSKEEKRLYWRRFDGKIASVRGEVISVDKGGIRLAQVKLKIPEAGKITIRFHTGLEGVKKLEPGEAILCSGFLGSSFKAGLKDAHLE